MDNIPYGYCHCGCGERTKIATKTDASTNRIKGRPMRFVKGHNGRKYFTEEAKRTAIRQRQREANRRRARENPEEVKHARRIRYQQEKEHSNALSQAYYWKHHSRRLAEMKHYREANRQVFAQWKKRNRHKIHEYEHRRRANKAKGGGAYLAEIVWTMLEDQDHLCCYCEHPLWGRFEVDHMMPISRGGSNNWDNLAICCPGCNRSKGAKTAVEFWCYLSKSDSLLYFDIPIGSQSE